MASKRVRASASVSWTQDLSLAEAAQVSAQVKQDANFPVGSYGHTTLDDSVENGSSSQPKNSTQLYTTGGRHFREDGKSDDTFWHETTQTGFAFDDDDASGKVGRQQKGAARNVTDKACDIVTTSGIVFRNYGCDPRTDFSNTSPSSPQVRAPDRSEVQKYATAIRIALSTSTAVSARPTSPKETVRNIVVGQSYFIEQHRSKAEKVELLDEALRLQDGNTILVVLLFLKRTLKPALFNQELMLKPRAASHYLSYLRTVKDNTRLMDTLAMLGMTEDAAMVKYGLVADTSEPTSKIRSLQSCLKSHLQSDPSLTLQSEFIKEEIKLLEMQVPIEDTDAQTEKEGKDLIVKEFPRSAALVGTPLIATLYYCCMYHYHKPAGHIANPMQIKDLFNLTEKQYMWTALTALTQIRHWREIDNLFQSKSWLGKAKMRCCIGFDRAVEVLVTMKAPPEVFEKYLQLVDDTERRLTLAKRYKCHGVVIDTLVSLRDREQLIRYREEVTPQTVPYLKIQEALNAAAIKWKN